LRRLNKSKPEKYNSWFALLLAASGKSRAASSNSKSKTTAVTALVAVLPAAGSVY
jgi:hypothetical protein